MPTNQPRIAMLLEQPIYNAVKSLAKRDNVSLSQKSRDLIIKSLDLFEDSTLEKISNERKKNKDKSISHDEIKNLLNLK